MKDLSQILEKLWDAYGKQHNERQIRVYYEWARTKDMSSLNRIVDIWIGSEKFFPSLSDLKLLYQKQTKSTSIDVVVVLFLLLLKKKERSIWLIINANAVTQL